MRQVKDSLPPFLIVLGFFLLWQIIASVIDLAFVLPTPVQILFRLWDLREALFGVHLVSTMKIILIGLFLSIVLGTSLAVWMNVSKAVEKAFYPLLIASQTIPIIALAPIFVLWFGYSLWSKVLVTLLITFFPITVNTFDGLRSSNNDLEELMRTMGASKKDIFLKLHVPSALPHFFSGLKVAVTLSVIGAAIGEWLGAEAGLGYFSRRMMTQFDGPGVFAPIILLSFLGMVLFLLVVIIEKIILKWRNSE